MTNIGRCSSIEGRWMPLPSNLVLSLPRPGAQGCLTRYPKIEDDISVVSFSGCIVRPGRLGFSLSRVGMHKSNWIGAKPSNNVRCGSLSLRERKKFLAAVFSWHRGATIIRHDDKWYGIRCFLRSRKKEVTIP